MLVVIALVLAALAAALHVYIWWLESMAWTTPAARKVFGTTPEETGQIWQAALDFENNASPHFNGLVLPVFRDKVAERQEQVLAAAEAVRGELATLEGRLADRQWLVGGTISAADLAIYPFLESLLRAAGKPAAAPLNLQLLPLEQSYPALAAWRRRIQALPGYEATYPPHWRDAA